VAKTRLLAICMPRLAEAERSLNKSNFFMSRKRLISRLRRSDPSSLILATDDACRRSGTAFFFKQWGTFARIRLAGLIAGKPSTRCPTRLRESLVLLDRDESRMADRGGHVGIDELCADADGIRNQPPAVTIRNELVTARLAMANGVVVGGYGFEPQTLSV
jgi:hypothetical protein